MPATHHSSPPSTPTSGTPPIRLTDTTVPPGAPETSSPAPRTPSAARPTAPERPSGPGPGHVPTARETPSAKGGPAPGASPADDEPTAPGTPSAADSTDSTDTADTADTVVGRIPVLDVRPLVMGGSRPAKAVVGEAFEVSATVFREGHDAVAANVVLRDPKGRPGRWTPMRELAPGTDRWGATVEADAPGAWTYTVEAWGDPISTWRHHAGIKIPAGIDTELVLTEGALLYERAAVGVPKNKGKREVLLAAAEALRDTERPAPARLSAALTPAVDKILARYPLRELVTSSEPLPLVVERERALYGAWYEFFPRSEGTRERPHGTFRSAARRLPAIAAMGFDVVYLPPVHPIGRTFRKGPNNTLSASAGDVGVPWAIGSADGGHDAVHPELGTMEDFGFFVAEAARHGLEIALDFALQCSPDHPWVEKYPQWFHHRPDGTIAYAENPPKKYQDIYPIAFDADLPGLVAETVRVLRHWMAHGVRIFRVDNPHTKPVVFWERVIAEINGTDPDVIFLAEAFTRPAMMRTLAQIGFQQSYTY
uniref:maltotransferase domain-containing protein n=1 Tax=Streptomyces graminilatus TaxID=1464070 RepID=UPI0006E337C1